MKKVYLLLVLILLLGLSLRVYNLGNESYWMDEAFSVHHAGLSDLSSLSYNVAMTEAAPMGYYVLIHYWINIFGNTEFMVRMLSVLFGVLSIVFLYLLVNLFFDLKVALLAAFLMSISMEQVLFSQEARIYSLFTSLVLLLVYFFARWFLSLKKKEEKRFFFYGYLFTTLAALYVNYITVVLIFLLSIILFWYFGRNKKVVFQWLIGHVVMLLLAIPVFSMSRFQFNSLNVNLTNSLESKELPSFLAKLGIFFYTLPILFAVLFVGILFIFRDTFRRLLFGEQFDWLFFSGLLSFGLIYLYLCFFPLRLFGIPLFKQPITNSYFLIRHSLFLAPIIYIYTSYRIVHLRSSFFRRASVVFLILVSLISLIVYYETPTKTQWREAGIFVHDHSLTKPLILLDKGGFSNEYLLHYYYPSDFDQILLTWGEGKRKLGQLSEKDLDTVLKDKRDFWVVFSKNEKTAAFYKNYFDSHYTLDFENDFYQIKVYHYTGNSTIS